MTIGTLHKIHKWLSVATLLAVLAWFASGLVLALPVSLRSLSPELLTRVMDPRSPSAPDLSAARVPIGDAIAAARARKGRGDAVSVRLRQLPGRLAYEVTLANGLFLVDALSGEPFTVDRPLALAIATEILPAAPRMTVSETTRPRGDREGTMEFSVDAGDSKGTILYIAERTAVVRYSDRLSRVMSSIGAWHDFSPLRRWMPSSMVHLTLFTFTVIGTLMSIAGVLILTAQFAAWRRRRRRQVAS